MKLQIETQAQGKTLFLHIEFASGKSGDYEYILSCGAGCGNDKLSFYLKNKKTGKSIREMASIKDIFEKWINAKIIEMESVKKTKP